MSIRFAIKKDMFEICLYDKHISKDELQNIIQLKRVLILEENEKFIGWLRYNLFWDNMPFLNMIYLLEENRNKGYGKTLIKFWEREMKFLGYNTVMTSTQSNEYSQHFYFKLGYRAIGGFLLESEPYEIILAKTL